MQGGHGYYGGRGSPPQGYGYGGGYGYDAAGGYYSTGGGYPAAAYGDPLVVGAGHEFPAPLNGLEFQPSETCPKNYVIFDQTCTKSRVMFHPSLAHKLGAGNSSGYDDQHHHHQYYDYYGGAQHGMGAYRDKDEDDDSCSGVRQKEDTAEIDALLSSDQDEDDVVSTGRTPSGYGGDGSSPDSTCASSYGGGGKQKRPKKERMKKMVRTLKGMIPGGSQMVDTPAVLDEAVRYLKSLEVEAKKLGVSGGSDS
jgi:hypothetical protein